MSGSLKVRLCWPAVELEQKETHGTLVSLYLIIIIFFTVCFPFADSCLFI